MKNGLVLFIIFIVQINFIFSLEYSSDKNTELLLHFDEQYVNNKTRAWNLIDSSENYNSIGKGSGGEYTLVPGIEGKAIYLDKDGEFIYVEQKEDYFLNESFTIEFYFVTFKGTSQPIISEMGRNNNYREYNHNSPQVFISSDKKLVFNNVVYGWGEYYLTSNQEILPNKWYHIAIVYDGEKIAMWINGKKEKSENIGRLMLSIMGNTNLFMIGREDSLYPNLQDCKSEIGECWFNGLIDELRISDIARKDFEINYPALAKEVTPESIMKEIEKIRLEESEENNWTSIQSQNTISEYNRYLIEFPNGTHILEAETKIEELKKIQEQNNLEEQKKLQEEEEQRLTEYKKRVIENLIFWAIVVLFILAGVFLLRRDKKRFEEEIIAKQDKIKREKIKLIETKVNKKVSLKEEIKEKGNAFEEKKDEWEDLTEEDIKKYTKTITEKTNLLSPNLTTEEAEYYIKKNFPEICKEVDEVGLGIIAKKVKNKVRLDYLKKIEEDLEKDNTLEKYYKRYSQDYYSLYGNNLQKLKELINLRKKIELNDKDMEKILSIYERELDYNLIRAYISKAKKVDDPSLGEILLLLNKNKEKVHSKDIEKIFFNYLASNRIAFNRDKIVQEYRVKSKEEELNNFETKLLRTNEKMITIKDLQKLDPYEFESKIGEIYRRLGYKVQVTKGSGDQGADLVIEKDGIKSAVQAKKYAGAVSNKAIQEVVGAMKFYDCDKSIVVTTGEFTPSARELAKANRVKLIDRDRLEELIDEAY